MNVTGRPMTVAGNPDDFSRVHRDRWAHFNLADQPESHAAVPCAPMSTLLRRAGLSHGGVGLLSIDVEGVEERVIEATDLRHFSLVVVEMDGTDPLSDARKHRHMLLSGFAPTPVHVWRSNVYMAADVSLRPGCELQHSTAAGSKLPRFL